MQVCSIVWLPWPFRITFIKKHIFLESRIKLAFDPSRPAMASGDSDQSWEYSLRKYLLLLATLVATVTYAVGFNPPGGVWQDTDAAAHHLAGDPIIRDTHYIRYLVFFYSNATAFVLSLVVIVLILLLAIRHEKKNVPITLLPLRVAMVLDLLSIMGTYAAGTCRDKLTTIYSLLLVAVVLIYLMYQIALASRLPDKNSSSKHEEEEYHNSHDLQEEAISNPQKLVEENRKRCELEDERLRKVLMLLATFTVSVTYVAGLSTPGGFWDSTEGGYRPSDAILKDHHNSRLIAFFIGNTTAFVASLLIIVLLLDKKLRESNPFKLYGCIIVALIGLIAAYAAGSCRETDTTIYVVSLVGAVLAYIVFHVTVFEAISGSCFWRKLKDVHDSVARWFQQTRDPQANNGREEFNQATEKARSLVLLLATLAATITYQAGLDPPGGLWQDNGDKHKAGDPILLTTNARRYKAFFYCNSVAFVASLVAIILVQKKLLLKHHVLEAAMILDLFGLIGAYAAGSCRDVNASIYVMSLAGAVLVYVVIHVVFFTLDHRDNGEKKDDESLEKRRKRLLLFAILAATITYQAGLTPPGGFRLHDDEPGHFAGDPVLLYNYPRRYKAFFYCNSVSFMLSIALIILLVNPNLYRPAIGSNALSVCTAVGMFGLVGAYAAGSTQHLKTSIYIFVLAAVVLLVVVLYLVCSSRAGNTNMADESSRKAQVKETTEKKIHAKRKYLMLLGILVASVTYQAGLDPPGGVWQHNSDRYVAGNPVMHDNRRHRFLAFFYSNSTSFVASIVVIILLLPGQFVPKLLQKLPKCLQEKQLAKWLQDKKWLDRWWLKVMNATVVLDLLALLGAYAAGSSRTWKTSVYVVALVISVLAYIVIHVMLSLFSRRGWGSQENHNQSLQQGDGGHHSSGTVAPV